MCPSYMATREEKHSTRGRAHLLWEVMQGNVIKGGWRNTEVKEALDLCLSCKACKTECPVNVDMATWKSEFLAHHYEGRLHPLQHHAFGFMDRWASIASFAPSIANLPFRLYGANKLLKTVLGVAPERELQHFAARNFRETHSDALNRHPNHRRVKRCFSGLTPGTTTSSRKTFMRPPKFSQQQVTKSRFQSAISVAAAHSTILVFWMRRVNICLGYSRSSLPRSMPVYPW
jgi:Fe-S oxidoreductase